MNRTINERKSIHKIFGGSILSYVGLLVFGWSIRKPTILFGAISIMSIFLGYLFCLWGAYGLGWEYKRIQMREEQNE